MKQFFGIDQQIINLYAKELITRQFSYQIEKIYVFECNEDFISDVTDKILQEINNRQNRLLDYIYPDMFIYAAHFSVKEDNRIKKLTAYVVFAITLDLQKDVIRFQTVENTNNKYWLRVLDHLRNPEVKGIMVIFADGLTGIRKAITTTFPNIEYQCETISNSV